MQAHWRHLMKGGDWLMLVMLGGAVIVSFLLMWRGGAADKVVVRAGGKVFAEVRLAESKVLDVPGPLGLTRIEIQPGRARVAADPGPRQYCVRQGWLTAANSIAICAPNEVSLSLVGRNRPYDSLAY
ncbi:MAG: hypothetical protein RIR70_2222 [Pseudomonadota bacterium]|jgi:hypothetical protein